MASFWATGSDGTPTNWLPLQSTFTLPTFCTQVFLNSVGGLTFGTFMTNTAVSGVNCLPTAVISSWAAASEATPTPVSLGPLVCPERWPTVQGSVNKDGASIVCCPPYYDLASASDSIGCTCSVTSGKIFKYNSATTSNGNVQWVLKWTTISTASVINAFPIQGYNVLANTVAAAYSKAFVSDTAGTTQTPNLPAPQTSTTSRMSITPTSTFDSTTARPDSPSATHSTVTDTHGLSSGAKAGIGVGVAVGVLALLLIASVLRPFYKRRRLAASSPNQTNFESEKVDQRYVPFPRSELDESTLHELPPRPATTQVLRSWGTTRPRAQNERAELESPGTRVEQSNLMRGER